MDAQTIEEDGTSLIFWSFTNLKFKIRSFSCLLKFVLEFECFLSRLRLVQMRKVLYLLPSLSFPIDVISQTLKQRFMVCGGRNVVWWCWRLGGLYLSWMWEGRLVVCSSWVCKVEERLDSNLNFLSFPFFLIIFVNFFFNCKQWGRWGSMLLREN